MREDAHFSRYLLVGLLYGLILGITFFCIVFVLGFCAFEIDREDDGKILRYVFFLGRDKKHHSQSLSFCTTGLSPFILGRDKTSFSIPFFLYHCAWAFPWLRHTATHRHIVQILFLVCHLVCLVVM